MGTSRVRFGGIFQGYIVARLRTGMYRIYHTKRSGDKVSLFPHLKVDRRRLQDMAFEAQAWLYTAIQCFACQRVKKGFDIIWYRDLMHLARYTGIFAHADSPGQTCIKSKNPDLPIWSNQTEIHRTVSVRHFVVRWPDRPGPFKRTAYSPVEKGLLVVSTAHIFMGNSKLWWSKARIFFIFDLLMNLITKSLRAPFWQYQNAVRELF